MTLEEPQIPKALPGVCGRPHYRGMGLQQLLWVSIASRGNRAETQTPGPAAVGEPPVLTPSLVPGGTDASPHGKHSVTLWGSDTESQGVLSRLTSSLGCSSCKRRERVDAGGTEEGRGLSRPLCFPRTRLKCPLLPTCRQSAPSSRPPLLPVSAQLQRNHESSGAGTRKGPLSTDLGGQRTGSLLRFHLSPTSRAWPAPHHTGPGVPSAGPGPAVPARPVPHSPSSSRTVSGPSSHRPPAGTLCSIWVFRVDPELGLRPLGFRRRARKEEGNSFIVSHSFQQSPDSISANESAVRSLTGSRPDGHTLARQRALYL